MNNNFRIIEGGKNENVDKEITIERIDKNQKIMSIRPQTLRIKLTADQLENIESTILKIADEELSVTYSRYGLQQQQAQEEANELEEMFKDDERVVVFASHKK